MRVTIDVTVRMLERDLHWEPPFDQIWKCRRCGKQGQFIAPESLAIMIGRVSHDEASPDCPEAKRPFPH